MTQWFRAVSTTSSSSSSLFPSKAEVVGSSSSGQIGFNEAGSESLLMKLSALLFTLVGVGVRGGD